MVNQTPELIWLLIAVAATGLMWVPHILQLMAQEGIFAAIYDPSREIDHEAAWARRARRAHGNAVENLVLFAPLVWLLIQTDATTEVTAMACAIFVAARLVHFIAYCFAVPVVRVLAFVVSWFALVVLAARVIAVL